jgi:hypothetical protein
MPKDRKWARRELGGIQAALVVKAWSRPRTDIGQQRIAGAVALTNFLHNALRAAQLRTQAAAAD